MSVSPPTVLVLGASSQIGHFLLPRLHAAGFAVLALSRVERREMRGVSWLRGGLPDAMPETLPPLTAIISYGPLLAFAQWLQHAALQGTPRIVATSSMSAVSKRDSAVPAEREISRQLREGEDALARTCTHRGLDWTVLRPTLVYGAGLDKSLTPIAHRALRVRVFPLPAGRGLRQPVHADDVASASMAALQNAEAAGQILPIGGGERLSAAAMFARVRDSLVATTLPLPLPAVLLSLGRRAVPRLRGPLSRLEHDLIADNTELERVLQIRPRPFRPDASCWIAPR